VRPEDKSLFAAAFERLSPESVYRRFFQTKQQLSAEELRYFTELDFKNHVALVVTLPQQPDELIGVGRFVRLPAPAPQDRAEVAFTVADAYQGQGVATLLLRHLVPLAGRLGIRHFEAEVQPDNRQMLEVFEHSGLSQKVSSRRGGTHVVMTLPAPER
jgi:RimJ/RimL family protein N-acetyltransferase